MRVIQITRVIHLAFSWYDEKVETPRTVHVSRNTLAICKILCVHSHCGEISHGLPRIFCRLNTTVISWHDEIRDPLRKINRRVMPRHLRGQFIYNMILIDSFRCQSDSVEIGCRWFHGFKRSRNVTREVTVDTRLLSEVVNACPNPIMSVEIVRVLVHRIIICLEIQNQESTFWNSRQVTVFGSSDI